MVVPSNPTGSHAQTRHACTLFGTRKQAEHVRAGWRGGLHHDIQVVGHLNDESICPALIWSQFGTKGFPHSGDAPGRPQPSDPQQTPSNFCRINCLFLSDRDQALGETTAQGSMLVVHCLTGLKASAASLSRIIKIAGFLEVSPGACAFAYTVACRIGPSA